MKNPEVIRFFLLLDPMDEIHLFFANWSFFELEESPCRKAIPSERPDGEKRKLAVGETGQARS